MPRYTQPRKRWFYPVNCKIKLVKLSLRDDAISLDVAEALGVHPLILST
ncbi:transposase [Pseudoalteromonas sp. 13-15]|nr:transposase [Pseudoalteromonas sp. 13-15]